ncbi:kinetochore protein Spc24 [Podarcis raffonei]|uniref:kinetochore protein Spc24 n=1 Tax=Podarcis raffonei TaxID=65483 RepID=UPI0023293B29|nr:kinetochore protein Spc24 [Podarcis raffonei]XP_053226571.1 kinetochore protein Spc24 [Podarcis raffonei]
MAALSEELQHLDRRSKQLLEMMTRANGAEMLKETLVKEEQMLNKLWDTQKSTAQLLKDLMTAEEKVALKLCDREQQLNANLQKLQKIEDELLQANEKAAELRTNTNDLRKELEALKEEIRQKEKNADNDAIVSKSAMYIVHLYYQICRIDWDYSCEPTIVKGIHYGPDIAQPINLDSSQHSRSFICDYLWNLVSTAW